ncbi:MAG: hypothetical protein HYT08_04310 [Candidatus Levybacteria bacterium]|nr:hypothetical protein [Candidatus Levybacteria bacterium]
MRNQAEKEKRNSAPTQTSQRDLISNNNVENVLQDLNKTTILNAGQVYLNGKNSIWIVEHHYFSSNCEGKVYFVAQIENGNVFKNVGNDCTKCPGSMPRLNISITKAELERKIEEDAFKERKLHELRSQANGSK